MKFHLYGCVIQRQDGEVRGHIVAPSRDRAWMVAIEHEEALGLEHVDLTVTRVDETLTGDHRRGLDALLESTPVGFASFCELGWVAHTAPVQQLKLYRLVNDEGDDLFAVAPNIDIAASVFTTALRVPLGETLTLRIADGMMELPANQVRNLPRLLECGPIGIVQFDKSVDGWSHR
ncbi:hypothetical protein K3181_13325 [Qipengyuania sp. YG27]|uniref:MOSC domain-containing protein n=1 Tax=Qipengyuania mesophila TaxID=2867246 RepID=A0ABS7JXX7_9SPHN|nr:hypothetical protein [Qipengyuania mesophila]MBX7502423.1 hypothetical protein [Qipengyuania mesophila]